jgi:hypothetical protein
MKDPTTDVGIATDGRGLFGLRGTDMEAFTSGDQLLLD